MRRESAPAGLRKTQGDTDTGTEGKVRMAVGRSLAWRRFLNDLSKAMLMTDPIAYGWYVAWTLAAEA